MPAEYEKAERVAEPAASTPAAPEPVGDDPVVVSNEDVANAMLAERGITPSPKATSQKKRYKRPGLARVSKILFGWRKKNKSSTGSV